MRRTTPPLQARGDILRAWTQVGTPSEVCRRLQGKYGRAMVNTVRDWATIHSHLQQMPPHGLKLSRSGCLWLAELGAGLDPDARSRSTYKPPSERPKMLPKQAKRLKRGSISHRILCYLNRNGADCASEMERALGLSRKRIRCACHTLQVHRLVMAAGLEMTIQHPMGERQAVVMAYRCTERGREAMEAAR